MYGITGSNAAVFDTIGQWQALQATSSVRLWLRVMTAQKFRIPKRCEALPLAAPALILISTL